MKIFKYAQYIKEEMIDTPESYINSVLVILKNKLDKLFDNSFNKNNKKKGKILKPRELKKKNTNSMTFKDLGIDIESSEISKFSKTFDSLTIKFSDHDNTYALIIMIDIEEAIPKESTKDFGIDDIENAYVKLKKYDLETLDIVGELSKNIKVKDINEEELIDLKLELDDKFGDKEEFEIETE